MISLPTYKIMQAPNQCIACGSVGGPKVWNDLPVLVCDRCGLGWRQTFDLPQDYYIKLNAEQGVLGQEKRAARLRNSADRLASLQGFLPRAGICDVGCGEGSFITALKRAGYTHCWGVEPSAYACRIAIEDGLDVVPGGIEDIARVRGKRAANALTLFHVIEHVSDPASALRLLKEALPQGGVLALETPDIQAPLQRSTSYRNPLIYPEHLFYFTEWALRALLEQAGFEICTVRRRSFDPARALLRALRRGQLRRAREVFRGDYLLVVAKRL